MYGVWEQESKEAVGFFEVTNSAWGKSRLLFLSIQLPEKSTLINKTVLLKDYPFFSNVVKKTAIITENIETIHCKWLPPKKSLISLGFISWSWWPQYGCTDLRDLRSINIGGAQEKEGHFHYKNFLRASK